MTSLLEKIFQHNDEVDREGEEERGQQKEKEARTPNEDPGTTKGRPTDRCTTWF
jgi:hypothetical protein